MKNCYVIGDPVDHSLSPQIHSAAYKYLEIDSEFIFERRRVNGLDEIKQFMENTEFHGLAVTSPNKQAILDNLDDVDEAAQEIGAVNTVVSQNGTTVGHNTDWIGAINALEERTMLYGKRAAVLGTSGSARAILYGLKQKNIQTTVFGRDIDKTIKLAKKFGAMPADFEAKGEIAAHDIIINATSVGMEKNKGTILLPDNFIEQDHVIFDLVYSPTLLVSSARKAKATVIEGLDMLVNQACPQITLMTGKSIDATTLRELLGWSTNG